MAKTLRDTGLFKWCGKHKIWASVIALVIIVAIGVSSGSSSQVPTKVKSTSGILATKQTRKTPALPAETHSQIVSDYENSATATAIADMAKDPNAFTYETVMLTGIIGNFIQNNSGNTTAMNVEDPNDASSIVYVQIPSSTNIMQLNKGDTLTIWGDGLGDMTGKNAFNSNVNEAGVQAVYLTDATSGYSDNSNNNPS